MGLISVTLPTAGQDRGSEEVDVLNVLTALVNVVNGDLDTNNLDPAAGITSAQLTSAVQQALLPTGSLVASALAAAPSGYLICDGSAVNRGTFAGLFAAIGTAYGVGDGTTTFNLPDLRGRAPVGKGTHTDVDVLADSDGLAVGSRTPNHSHAHTHTHTNSHAHTYSGTTTTPLGGAAVQSGVGTTVANSTHTHDFSGSTSTANITTSAPSTVNTDPAPAPYQVVNWMIKT